MIFQILEMKLFGEGQKHDMIDKFLGDFIAIITFYTKLDLLTNWFFTKVLKKDCGCSRRKKSLNKKFKFK